MVDPQYPLSYGVELRTVGSYRAVGCVFVGGEGGEEKDKGEKKNNNCTSVASK